jgi:peptide-methionine (S)-S-oxide reductase
MLLDRADPAFRDAVAAIDDGDAETLRRLIAQTPSLLLMRADVGEGYFARPYLVWFVAGNPVRRERLAPAIVEIADVLLQALVANDIADRAMQIDTALALVVSGRVARESGVQHALIERFAAAGANVDAALLPALAHRETAAVRCLLACGATTTLTVDAALGNDAAFAERIAVAGDDERREALAVAALYGRADRLAVLIAARVDLDAYSPAGLHQHATALHHAVDAGSLDAVMTLVAAGASTGIRDRVHGGTPLDWARHLGRDAIAFWLEDRASGQETSDHET